MTSKTSPWVWGCGLGCVGLVVISLLLGGGVYWFFSDTVSGFEEAVNLRVELESEYGKPESFIPEPDGAIPPDRMEVFLRVRELTQERRQEIVSSFEELPMTEEEGRELEQKSGLEFARSLLGIIGSGVGLGGRIGRFMEARNRALLESQMGLGEYTYIYALAYYSWLKHSPQEGPHSRSRVKIDVPKIGRDLHRRLVQILQNQLEVIGSQADPALARELEKLRDDRSVIPYAEGLPPKIENSLKPYRERLESTYNPITNQFELSLNTRTGRFSFQSD